MDSSRVRRLGKPRYRNTYVPPNIRQDLEDRFQLPGISANSSSSWTFSNNHYDVPKPKKGRFWRTFLIGAALVVALTVVAIGGLAFYMGGYTSEKHKFNEYQIKNNTNAKLQFSTQNIETTQKSITQISTKTSSEDQTSNFVSRKKVVPEGAIFGNSDAMKRFKDLKKNRKEEQTTTEAYEDYFLTTFENEQLNESKENINLAPEKLTTSFGFTKVGFRNVEVETNYDTTYNGQASPTLPEITQTMETTTKTTSTSTSFLLSKKEYFEEPWRPIVPPYKDLMRNQNSFREEKIKVGLQQGQGSSVNPTLIAKNSSNTLRIESYKENLQETPESTENHSVFKFKNHNSKISEKKDIKYKNLVNDQEADIPLRVTETTMLKDDMVTMISFRSPDAVKVNDDLKQPILTTTFYASDKSSIKNEKHPVNVDQVVAGISLTERNAESSTVGEISSEVLKSFRKSNKTERVRVFFKSTEPSVKQTLRTKTNSTVQHPFLDNSRSSVFNFGIPDFPLLKQFHHLDSLFKSFSKTTLDTNFPRHFTKNETDDEATVTRFPVRKKQTTIMSYKNEDVNFHEFSTVKMDSTTVRQHVVAKPVVVKGQVEIVSAPVKQISTERTTQIPKLITLLPVKSNVGMMRPLRPRPKLNLKSTITDSHRKSKMNLDFVFSQSPNMYGQTTTLQHPVIDDKNGKPWVYSSSTYSGENEKAFVFTPEPKTSQLHSDFLENLTSVPLYNTVETLLSLDLRKRPQNGGCRNTSEIVNDLIKVVGNVAISTGDSLDVVVKVNESLLNRTKEKGTKNRSEEKIEKIPTKADLSYYKLNEAGVPILTKILHKAPISIKEYGKSSGKKVLESDEKGCERDSVRCGNGKCISFSKKCNQIVDCPNAEDEKNCTCAEYLKTQGFEKNLCDGVVDCWDFTDEYSCQWCQGEFLCSNSKVCISKNQICDGENNCPFGDDENRCVTVSPSEKEAETLNYYYNGYIMVRKNGYWAKLCIDNFDSLSDKTQTEWKLSELGRVVCKGLTFKDFDEVERLTSVPIEGNTTQNEETDKYYELIREEKRATLKQSTLRFRETNCSNKQVIKVACTDLECGMRPRETHQGYGNENLPVVGSRRSRIVGGGNAGPGSWPWQAALYKEGEFQCGGTLVSENWLLSAGHCFYQNRNAYWVARLGILRKTLFLPSPYEQLRHIIKIILHPQYKENGFINDISLLKMQDSVRFTDYVRPICLPKPEATIVDGTMCTVVGWGQLSEVGWVFPDTLQEVRLPLLSSNECRKRTVFFPLYNITDDMFCAGYERGGRDACLGDSGGPLMCLESDGRWSLFGITSNGYGCARTNRPGVYTKVSKYLKWIYTQISLYSESATENESFKRKNESTLRDKH